MQRGGGDDRHIAGSQVTMWWGQIFSARRRQNAVGRSPGVNDRVGTKPLSMKKKDTPMGPGGWRKPAGPRAEASTA